MRKRTEYRLAAHRVCWTAADPNQRWRKRPAPQRAGGPRGVHTRFAILACLSPAATALCNPVQNEGQLEGTPPLEPLPTFAEAAEHVLEQKRGGWRGRWHAQNWWRSMERYAFPRIGRRPVSEVNTADVLEILTPIWNVKAETARAVRHGRRLSSSRSPTTALTRTD